MISHGEIEQLLKSIDTNVRRIADALIDQPPPKIESGQAYTRKQAALLLGVSTWTVDRARHDGQLIEAERIGERSVRITGESILRFNQREESRRQVLKL